MVQIKIFNHEYEVNGWLRDHPEHVIKDIKPINCKVMVIYEDLTIEQKNFDKAMEDFKHAPIQAFPSSISTDDSHIDYTQYSIYLNG